MEIQLKTLTPIWTGGVKTGQMDRLHETGIIGSLRWWYEAIVRGVGGHACDPTSDSACQFDAKAYEEAKKQKDPDAVEKGLINVCPACRLFGCTGWKRLFTLQSQDVPTVPFHLRTTLPINKNWFERSFSKSDFDVAYGGLTLRLITRRQDLAFTHSQIALLLNIAADYGGIGAKQQHGFGQFSLQQLPPELQNFTINESLAILSSRINPQSPINTPFNLKNFVSLEYDIPSNKLSAFRNRDSHYGSSQKQSETAYIPCAFDLRYKGKDSFGFRRWLKEQKRWNESDRKDQLGDLDKLMGPRSEWGEGIRKKSIDNDLRTASRLFFGMPYKQLNDIYRLRIFGFAPPELIKPAQLIELVQEYTQVIFQTNASQTTLGADILKPAGETQ
jgi:CRISPR-associated protein Cmr1